MVNHCVCGVTLLNIEEIKNHRAKTDPSHILDIDKENETTFREEEDLRQTINWARTKKCSGLIIIS